MFAAILILLLLPITDVSRSRGMQFRPLSKVAFFVFVANFLILMQLGAKHVESPFIEFGQISTVLYFSYFTFIMYGVTVIENTFVDARNTNFTIQVNSLQSSMLQSSMLPRGILGFNSIAIAEETIKNQICHINILIKKLNKHLSELNELDVIAKKGDNKQLSVEDMDNWRSKFNPNEFRDTASYVLLFNFFSESINTRILNLISKLNECNAKYFEFSVRSLELQLICLENGTDSYQINNIYSQIIGIIDLENNILIKTILEDNNSKMEDISLMHKEINALRNENFSNLHDYNTNSILFELDRLEKYYPKV